MMLTDLRRKISIYLLLVVSFTGCDDNPYSLRSSDYEFYYTINNKDAADRLASVMYNKTDTAHPVERFKIVHISDSHLSSWSKDNHSSYPNNLIESVAFANQSALRINAMLATGDHISDTKKNEALANLNTFYKYLYTDNRIPTFPCYGNHDNNVNDKSKSEFLTSAELANVFDNKGNYPLQRKAGKSYFYADVKNPMGGVVRIIALDMTDRSRNEFSTMVDAVFSQEQVDWLGNEALKQGMTDQHSVIIITHYPFQPYRDNGSTYLIEGNFSHTYKMIPEIVEAYRSKTSIKKVFQSMWGSSNPISVDFDFSESSGEFICYMGGHVHSFALFDIVGLDNANENLLPQRMIICTNQAPTEKGVVFNRVSREDMSISSNSFNIYAIDTQERKIHITFFGAYKPSDKKSFPEILELTY